jgi:hypothetical protein
MPSWKGNALKRATINSWLVDFVPSFTTERTRRENLACDESLD